MSREKLDTLYNAVRWNLSGAAIEAESFRRIDEEAGAWRERFTDSQWHVARRLVHTCADFSILESLVFANEFMEAAADALRRGVKIYCDSSMIRSGISMPRLQKMSRGYTPAHLICKIADSDTAKMASEMGTTRALAAVRLSVQELDGALILIGNAPLALAAISKSVLEHAYRPAAVIGLPVGFVNVMESKALLAATDLPYMTISGRRGGSTLAVAALHALTE